MKPFLLLVCYLFLSIISHAQSTTEQTFESANQAYQKGEYVEAIALYEDLLDEEQISISLYYNLATAYLNIDEIGKAIYYYRKAHNLSADEAIQANLAIARDKQLDQMAGGTAGPLKIWTSFVNAFSANTWAVGSLLLFWLGIAGLIVWKMATERSGRKRGFLVGVIALVFSLLMGISAYFSYRLEKNSTEVVLLSKQAKLYIAPDTESETLQEYHEGLEMVIQDSLGAWYEVRLSNGQIGWFLKKELGVL